MWLLNICTRKLEYFEGNKIPSYAILSHRWEHDEVTLQEIKDGRGGEKHGYRKVDMCCKQARKDCPQEQLSHVWVDTCCIDKTSSAELSEAINSMYQWYKDAAVCYAYLSDVKGDVNSASFKNSLWFTRGWTLQELLAPENVIFFDRSWRALGTKVEHAAAVSRITGIPPFRIQSFEPSDFCVANLMSFAAKRQTTREEDRAYSLLGPFQVNMPLIYGEGTRAFTRLQEENIKSRHDLTILAWRSCDARARIFAHSPSDFDNGTYLYSGSGEPSSEFDPETAQPLLSAIGLSVELELVPIHQFVYLAIVGYYYDRSSGMYAPLGMMLREEIRGYGRYHDGSVSATHDYTRSHSITQIHLLDVEPRPSFTIAASPECGHITHFGLTGENDTGMLNVNTSGAGIFDIIHMRMSSSDAQFLVFGADHDWQPFCLASRNAELPKKSCTPDASVYVPQLATYELTVGCISDMMTLVNAMESEQSQKWNLQDGSVELYVLQHSKQQTSSYLSSGHYICLKPIYGHSDTIDVRIDKEFHVERTPRPHRWSWRQL
ncbi:hypothetical protein LTR70_006617 [Exophiala xenobiotica]|uniref:Heterokaryon incompatibility domain-containing protein n=1 Tax=Lithohypha guttulata TaxID=1690604 RepID=A0ABR0K7R1_9EURO|nr:hypothetical protein LTR24_005936 [Lithohypha guttulata]KAK5315875.1 hypothetical protein LTR70_006617 [Exophiala xenobiotica]